MEQLPQRFRGERRFRLDQYASSLLDLILIPVPDSPIDPQLIIPHSMVRRPEHRRLH